MASPTLVGVPPWDDAETPRSVLVVDDDAGFRD
jgi:hypothetical protein